MDRRRDRRPATRSWRARRRVGVAVAASSTTTSAQRTASSRSASRRARPSACRRRGTRASRCAARPRRRRSTGRAPRRRAVRAARRRTTSAPVVANSRPQYAPADEPASSSTLRPRTATSPRSVRHPVPRCGIDGRPQGPLVPDTVSIALGCAAWIWGSASPARSTTSPTPCSPRSSATRTCGSPTARCCGRTATRRWRWPPAGRRGSRSAPASPSPARAPAPSPRPPTRRSTGSRRGGSSAPSAAATRPTG